MPARSREALHLCESTACRVWRKRGRSAQAIGRSRGDWTTKVHAPTDLVGRPYALMLNAGNVSDIKAAPALLQRAGGMRYLLADRATTLTNCGAHFETQVLFRSSLGAATASAPSATTISPTTSSQAWLSPTRCERV